MNQLITILIILIAIYILFTFFTKITKFVLIGAMVIIVGLLIFQTITAEEPTIEPIIVPEEVIEETNITDTNSTQELIESNSTDSVQESS